MTGYHISKATMPMGLLCSSVMCIKSTNVNSIKSYFHLFPLGIGHEEDVDVEVLPPAIPKGNFAAVKFPTNPSPTTLIFDLETTDLSESDFMCHLDIPYKPFKII